VFLGSALLAFRYAIGEGYRGRFYLYKKGGVGMTFQIITIAIVLSIFALFAYGAARAEKVVAAKAQETRDAIKNKATTKTAGSKANKNVVK
jgi:hypothetical protein